MPPRQPLGPTRMQAGTGELVQAIRSGLALAHPRRIGSQHAAVLGTLLEMDEPAPDARAIYRALQDAGRGMVMARLYRMLRVLEEAKVVTREWSSHGNRPVSTYRAEVQLHAMRTIHSS